MTSVIGQVVYRRPLSRRLVFYDMDCTDAGRAVELIVKIGHYGNELDIRNLRDSLKVGDKVQACGVFESDSTLVVSSLLILERWCDTHGTAPFKPYQITVHSQCSGASDLSEHNLATGLHNTSQPEIVGLVAGSHAEQMAADAADHKQHDLPQPSTPTRQVCKFWINTGRCTKGSNCPFAHLDRISAAAARAEWQQQRMAARAVLAQSQGFVVHSAGAQQKSRRTQLFCEWLVNTYGREHLNSGTGVLDVAGGHGAISFELQAVHGIGCTLVEPRPFKLSNNKHRRIATEMCGTAAKEVAQIQALFGPDLWNSSQHSDSLRACSMVVGMHPDQATDAIVQFAMEAGKCFAVVPCCVFPRQFEGRRLVHDDGTSSSVTSYSELVRYLQQQGGGLARVHAMPFEGANQVVYTTLPEHDSSVQSSKCVHWHAQTIG